MVCPLEPKQASPARQEGALYMRIRPVVKQDIEATEPAVCSVESAEATARGKYRSVAEQAKQQANEGHYITKMEISNLDD